jgi:hypothetical protein
MILANGVNFSSEQLLFPVRKDQDFARGIEQWLTDVIGDIRGSTEQSSWAFRSRSEVERERSPDIGDPKAVGWTYLINGDHPNQSNIRRAMLPLAEHRGMANPDSPLIFPGGRAVEWFHWLQEHYFGLPLEDSVRPFYVLCVGSPQDIPFKFQSLLGSAAAVGRLDFDSVDDIYTYVSKVKAIEKANRPLCSRDVVVFAPDYGVNDPTFFSREYLATPIANFIRRKFGVDPHRLFGHDATKENLSSRLKFTRRPALLLTASHGLGAPDESFETQKQLNGAICCQRAPGLQRYEWLFGASDVPPDPFLQGSVVFQFACFGYGTPAESDFAPYVGVPAKNTVHDFVAALPKRLLAHPDGPIAFIGHVDTAWMHGFEDPRAPFLMEQWHPRIQPFVALVEQIMKTQPVGWAMADMSKKYDWGNAVLLSAFNRLEGYVDTPPDEFYERLIDIFIQRTDAQNYMILGDPAARVRIPGA